MTDEEFIKTLTGEVLTQYEADAILKSIENLKAENAALRERLEKAVTIPFDVIDMNTGKEPDECEIANKEEWARNLCHCDMSGFAIMQDGTLIILDECGAYSYCPHGRFEIKSETRLAELKGGKG